MHATETPTTYRPDLASPQRNHYFFGKMLDVYHFELETNYMNAKRWLLNRLVSGYGVVCGLNLRCHGESHVVVTSGVAIDKWGREIIVPHETRPLEIPLDLVHKAAQSCGQQDKEEHPCVSVWLCYHECLSDPVPVLAGDCHTTEICSPGTIREQYSVEFKDVCLERPSMECRIPHIICDRQIDHAALAKWVSCPCPAPDPDSCIPLANIRFPKGEKPYTCHQDNIDISVRPIVYTNDLLFELLKCLLGEASEHRKTK